MKFKFQKFNPKGMIYINKSNISFGSQKPPFEYLNIEYDAEAKAIRFTQGSKEGYKVHTTHSGYYTLQPSVFIKAGYLPFGKYLQVDELTYRFKEDQANEL